MFQVDGKEEQAKGARVGAQNCQGRNESWFGRGLELVVRRREEARKGMDGRGWEEGEGKRGRPKAEGRQRIVDKNLV